MARTYPNRDIWLNLLEALPRQLHPTLISELLKKPALFRKREKFERAKTASSAFELTISVFRYESQPFGDFLNRFIADHSLKVGKREVPRTKRDALTWRNIPLEYLRPFITQCDEAGLRETMHRYGTRKRKRSGRDAFVTEITEIEGDEEEEEQGEQSENEGAFLAVARSENEDEPTVPTVPTVPTEKRDGAQKHEEAVAGSAPTPPKRQKLANDMDAVQASQDSVRARLVHVDGKTEDTLINYSHYLLTTNENLETLRVWNDAIQKLLGECVADRKRILQYLRDCIARESDPEIALQL